MLLTLAPQSRWFANLPLQAIGAPLAVVGNNMHENGHKINRKPLLFPPFNFPILPYFCAVTSLEPL
jgi:hypothetical protein